MTTDKFGRDISDAWKADPKYQQAFDALKEKLCEYAVLRLPDLSKPYVCCSDASDYALGAALCQEIDRKLVVIEYASRTLPDCCRLAVSASRSILLTGFSPARRDEMRRWASPAKRLHTH